MMLATSKLRWHQLKWRQKRVRKAWKRTSTQNPRPLWNNWQNSRVSLKRMEQSRLGMLQWVHQTLGLGRCPLCGSPDLLPLLLSLTELAVSGFSWRKWLLILQLNASGWLFKPRHAKGSFSQLPSLKIWFCGLPLVLQWDIGTSSSALSCAVGGCSGCVAALLSFGGQWLLNICFTPTFCQWACCCCSSLCHSYCPLSPKPHSALIQSKTQCLAACHYGLFLLQSLS